MLISKAKDLTGMRFGRLTAIEIASHKPVKWKCVCDCGNIVNVQTCHLISGHTQSCGCYMRDRVSEANSKDLTGMQFGRLIAINRVPVGHVTPAGQELVQYQCMCECGNFCDVLAMNLVKGNTQSCGCIGASSGEALTEDYFKRYSIPFCCEYWFDNLRSSTSNRPLRFDFALMDSDSNVVCLVEYQGEQHYYAPERNTDFGRQQREVTDKLKRDYCSDNDIQLFEIRYDDELESQLDIVREYYLAHKAG